MTAGAVVVPPSQGRRHGQSCGAAGRELCCASATVPLLPKALTAGARTATGAVVAFRSLLPPLRYPPRPASRAVRSCHLSRPLEPRAPPTTPLEPFTCAGEPGSRTRPAAPRPRAPQQALRARPAPARPRPRPSPRPRRRRPPRPPPAPSAFSTSAPAAPAVPSVTLPSSSAPPPPPPPASSAASISPARTAGGSSAGVGAPWSTE